MSATRLGIRASDRTVAGAEQLSKRLDGDLVELAAPGAPLSELYDALRDGRADAVVVAATTATLPDGLVLGAVPKRRDARDALLGSTKFALLADGAQVRVGSPLRRALVLAHRPGLAVELVEANGLIQPLDGGGVIDALAVLENPDEAVELFDLGEWPPAAGQGALFVLTRRGDTAKVAKADHRPSRLAVLAELGLLDRLGADLGPTLAAHASLDDGLLFLSARLFRADGSESITSSHALYPEDSHDPTGELATRVADELLALGAAGFAAGGTR